MQDRHPVAWLGALVDGALELVQRDHRHVERFRHRLEPPSDPARLGALAGWEWDVALLQETPPWWPEILAATLGCEYRLVLTSRNGLLSLRRAIAVRRPDLMKSNGGGCNAILARRDRIVAHRVLRLC